MISLRPFQQQVLSAFDTTDTPKHVLCIAPTGSGKSLIYETLAQKKNQKMVLLTPLIALAHQQATQLKNQGVSVFFGLEGNPEIPPNENHGGVWILSPEALHTGRRQAALKKWKPHFLVIDECHCVWEWGTDGFRPLFSEVFEWIKHFEISKSLWLTATLPKKFQITWQEILGKGCLQLGEFELPSSIKLLVKKVELSKRLTLLTHFLSQQDQAGILFTLTRAGTQRLARYLEAFASTQKKRRIVTYHAGFSVEEKRNLEQQIREKKVDWVIATSAFGMGMNYAHLNFVVVWQLPPSILSLVQMIGRVGRGHFTHSHKALIFWNEEDFELLSWTTQHSTQRQQDLIDLRNLLEKPGCLIAHLKAFFGSSLQQVPCHQCSSCLPFTNSLF